MKNKYRIFEDDEFNSATDDAEIQITPEVKQAAETVKDAIGENEYQNFIMKLTGLKSLPDKKTVANIDKKVTKILNLGLKDLKLEGEKLKIDYGVSYPVKELLPTQAQIGLLDSIGWLLFVDPEAAKNPLQGMARFINAESGNEEYILTANGKYILDGHHRWSQTYIMNPNAKIKAVNINFPETKNTISEMLKVIQMAIGAAYGGIYLKPADAPTDIFAIPSGESSLKMVSEILNGKYGFLEDVKTKDGKTGKRSNVKVFCKTVLEYLPDLSKESEDDSEDEVEENEGQNENFDFLIYEKVGQFQRVKRKISKYLAKNADLLREKNGKLTNIPRVIMPQPSDTRDKVGGDKKDINGIPAKFLKGLETGKVNFSQEDGILPKDSSLSQVSKPAPVNPSTPPNKSNESKKYIRTYEQFVGWKKTVESFGEVQKFEINGVELSQTGDEIYFQNIDQVVRFESPKMAETAFKWCKLHAEDGKSEKQIYQLTVDNLRKMN